MENIESIQTKILEFLPDAVIIHCMGRIVFVNKAAVVLAGAVDARELIGKPIEDFIPFVDRNEVRKRIKKLLRHKIQHSKWELVKLDGETVLCEVSATVIKYGGRTSILTIVRDVSERYRIEEELIQQRGYFQQLFENSPDGIIMVDNDDKIMLANPSFLDLFGYNEAEVINHPINDLIVPGHLEDEADGISNTALSGKVVKKETVRMRKDGSLVEVSIIGYPIFINGVQVGIYGIYSDISKRKQAERDLHESEERYRKLIEHLPEAILVHVDGRIVLANEAAVKLLGAPGVESLLNRHFLDIMHPDYMEISRIRLKMVSENRKDMPLREQKIIRYDGTFMEVEMSATWFNYKGEDAVLSVIQDITERKKAEETINKLAYYDILTGLPNRVLFKDRFTLELAHAQRNKQGLTVLFLDLDRFKSVNDSLGHRSGDELLREVASRLKRVLRKVDTISRMGGDEFIILLPEVSKTEDIRIITKKILGAIQKPFIVNSNQLYITTSIGVCTYPKDGEDMDTLIKNADAAMYKAKEMGGNSCLVYSESISSEIGERMHLLNELKGALDKGQFVLDYQPRFNMETGKINGVEALIRWEHPKMGRIPPAKLIPLAEEIGMIIPIGEWVLKTACALNKTWQDNGLPNIRIAVNISPRQLQSVDFPSTVKRILHHTGLKPEYLELEITEAAVRSNLELCLETINRLKEIGVCISMDDFGTGYSCLSHIRNQDINILKINPSLFRDLKENPSDRIITQSVISMAHKLGIEVTAEGVEEKEHVDVLEEMKCDHIQGYIFSKPLPQENFEELLKANGRRP
jgi:diguanylate cyclase (GGDEF)-like protein/PAS domain S-box-containing protein